MKTGHCVWLELASIFLSLVFEKTLQMAKKLVKMIGWRYVCYHITGAVCEIGQIVEIGDSKLALDVRGKDFGWLFFCFCFRAFKSYFHRS